MKFLHSILRAISELATAKEPSPQYLATFLGVAAVLFVVAYYVGQIS